MKDKLLVCVTCGNEFPLSIEEQEKLFSRGFDIPKRCPGCRRKKTKSARESNHEWRRKGKKRHLREKEIHLG